MGMNSLMYSLANKNGKECTLFNTKLIILLLSQAAHKLTSID